MALMVEVGGMYFEIDPKLKEAIDKAVVMTENEVRKIWFEMPDEDARRAARNIIVAYMEME